jgi:hypothetical protein
MNGVGFGVRCGATPPVSSDWRGGRVPTLRRVGTAAWMTV